MVFSSLNFLFIFLPSLLVCYFLLPAGFREGRNFVLLAFSLLFYGCAGMRFLPLMLVSILINYIFALAVTSVRHSLRKPIAVLCVACNLLLLGWFKYAMFAAGVLNDLGFDLSIPQIVLPIGISFFTFQGMSYVFDVYRGQAQAERNILHIALYISLFPQLVAGPIVRYTTVADNIQNRRETVADFADGASRFLFGFSKKMLLANPMGQIADAAFNTQISQLSPGMAWLGLLAYAGQIYFDFSGYSDMAIGLGRMFGFHFLENFNYPYISKSVTEFWRRWHISLGSWFRDYVYIPLGGNRCTWTKQLRNVLIVWMLTGFWHGAQWNFLIWGLYYGLLLLGEKHLWGQALSRAPGFLRHIYALFFILLGWVFFRADSLSAAVQYLTVMFGFGEGMLVGQSTYYLLQFRWELLVALLCCLPLKCLVQQLLERVPTSLSAIASIWGPRILALSLGAFSFAELVSSTFNPFIYFRF